MSDFITGGLSSNVSFTAAWFTDAHMRTDEPRLTNLLVRRSALITKLQSKQFDVFIDSGDMLEGDTGGTPGSRGDLSAQYALYAPIRAAHAKPDYFCLGNHDLIGMDTNDVLAAFDMPSRYYYIDQGSKWRLVFMDSFIHSGDEDPPYGLGATQMTWLESVIADATAENRHVCLISHIPIISIGAMAWYIYNYQPNADAAAVWNNKVDQHGDAYALMELIRLNPCIKGAISGHTHTCDECKYPAISVVNPSAPITGALRPFKFLLGGSVSAFYWNTSNEWMKNYAGFNMLSFFEDGNIERQITYY